MKEGMDEASFESNMQLPIWELSCCKQRKTSGSGGLAKGRKTQGKPSKRKAEALGACEETSTGVEEDYSGPGIRVSPFDYSVENHFRAMDTISKLCGEATEEGELGESEVKRLSSSVTFLREWRLFNYDPRDVRFACQLGSSEGKKVTREINLGQFSSATVSKKEGPYGDFSSVESRDFVIYAGGPVWGLDWCPTVCESPDSRFKCEFIAIAAHPPASSYHKMGAPVSGRGLIQIWSLLNINGNEGDIPPEEKPKRGRKKSAIVKEKPSEEKRPRGRPRKIPIKDARIVLDGNSQCSGQVPKTSSNLLAIEGIPRDTQEHSVLESAFVNEKPCEVKRPRGRPRKKPMKDDITQFDGNSHIEPLDTQVPENSSNLLAIDSITRDTPENSVLETPVGRENCHGQADSACNLTPETMTQTRHLENKDGEENGGDDVNHPPLDEQNRSSILCQQIPGRSGDDPRISSNFSNDGDLEISSTSCPIPNDVALPRVFLCLAHNGKVAWDVKWRPSNSYDSKYKHRMGFLAALLGDGSLQVWEVPLPHTIRALYSSLHGENTDPRFVKLEPVFKCSILKSGGEQSIPLTVEWSTSSPHEFLLAGCHDGTVALWKFSLNASSKDTRPLLRFSADTVPLRAVAWAPVESDTEGANVILTAGHGGLKFWDIRDPFRPLWELNPVPRNIYSLDWFPDPRCVVLSFDDGTMRTLSLSKAAYDVPVTGKPFVGTKQQGLHSYYVSSYAIWCVHVSRSTGMVACCSADGTVLRFQLTTKAVDKDASRNRAPLFLCGSLTKDESTITINTATPNTPFPFKKSMNNTPIALRDVLSVSSQAKRSNDKIEEKHPASNDQALAFCYGDYSEGESEPEETLASIKKKKPSKSGSSTKKNVEENLALLHVDDGSRYTEGKETEKSGKTFELLPSKDVAIHRVRWNMNKGSERWLCYGGAAGLVHCQEIVLLDIDKKWAKKK